MAGLMSVTGEAGRGPMRVGIALADLSAGLFAAMGILTALYERERSGRGQWVQTSLLAAQLFMLDFQGARWLMQGEVPQQSGNNHPTGVPTGSFRTRDGWANIAPTPPMWARFCKAIGHPEWIAHADYATPALRRKHRDALNALIEAVTSLQRDPRTRNGYDWGGGLGPDLRLSPGTGTDVSVLVEWRQPISYLIPLLRDVSGIY
jgi:formyl-CoA transferase